MDNNAQTIMLTRFLDLTAAEPLTENLLRMRGKNICLDASEVDRLGALCLQVLLSAEKTWRGDGGGFEIKHPSSNFLSALTLFGISASYFSKRVSPT